MLPFNVYILDQRKLNNPAIKPVRVMDHFDGVTSNFHEEGLFSISTFGRVGDDARDKRISYINVKADIFHPLIFHSLVRLKGLYKEILAGKRFAKWDTEVADFVPCSDLEGDTGYAFFVKHWKKIRFKPSRSVTRSDRIKLIEKYRDLALGDKVVVIPAGLRDLQVDDYGRVSEDEINALYRRLISISNAIPTGGDKNDPILNVPRYSLQMTFNEIYALIERMLTGKKGFIQSKWGSRRVFNGTRNVISAMDTSAEDLDAANHPGVNHTVLGLYQTIKGALPLTRNFLLTGWVGQAFAVGNGQAYLIDKRTWQRELVELPSETFDRWTTKEGIEKVINSYSEDSLRNRPVEIEGRYLGLIYLGPDKTFKIFGDISELPEELDRKYVQPLTLCQLIYLSGYREWYDLHTMVTRYPVAGLGSIYVSKVYVKTTVVGEMRWELGEDWQRRGDAYVALEFPTLSPDAHVNSLIPHSSRLAGLGGDYDGDTCSANILYTKQAIEEAERYLKSKAAYLDPQGGLRASMNIDTVALVLNNMTGD